MHDDNALSGGAGGAAPKSDPPLFPATPVQPRASSAGPAKPRYANSRLVGALPGTPPPLAGPPPGGSGTAGTSYAPPQASAAHTAPARQQPRVASEAYVGYVGAIDGQVLVSTEYHRFWGFQALFAAGILATVGVVGRVLLGGVVALVNTLVMLLVLLVVLHFISRLLFGRRGRPTAWALRHTGSALKAATRIATRAAASAGKHAVAASKSKGGMRMGRAQYPLTTRRFRVQSASGETRTFVMRGELKGNGLRRGDIVRVAGGRPRGDHLVVRSVAVLATPSGPLIREVTARPPAGYLITQWGSRLCFVLAVLILLWGGLAIVGIIA